MNISKYFNKKRVQCGIIIYITIVTTTVVLKAEGPPLLVVNSIPGQTQLTEQQRFEILNNTVNRIPKVDKQNSDFILSSFANRKTDKLSFNTKGGVISIARIVLANFSLNTNVETCNQLLKKIEVWGSSGSTWQLNKNGDYDFAAIWITTILYEFGENENILYPDTKQYLINVLLPDEGKLDLSVPKTLGSIYETENHLLMREGSRYLKNQWLKSHGNKSAKYDNDKNGMTKWFESYLNDIRLHGIYEYNSVPYLSYTMLSLMNLAEYAKPETIRKLAESILDEIFYCYAYGSFNLKQCAPFRRRFEHAEDQGLYLNRCHILVRFWLNNKSKSPDQLELASIIHNYSLPQSTFELFKHRPEIEYYKIFNHDQDGSPEIYSGGPNYLLSAGGSYRGEMAKVISRPITLLLNDNSKTIKECIHIQGTGQWQSWNMTGVHKRFAVAKGTIFIPEKYNYKPKPGWNVVMPNNDITVAFYQGQKMAILLVLPDIDLSPSRIIKMLEDDNPSIEKSNTFNWPQQFAPPETCSVKFNINATNETLTITDVDNNK